MVTKAFSLVCMLSVLCGALGDVHDSQESASGRHARLDPRAALEKMARRFAPAAVHRHVKDMGAQLTPEIGAPGVSDDGPTSVPTSDRTGAVMAASGEEKLADGIARWPAPGRASELVPQDAVVISPGVAHSPRVRNSTTTSKNHKSQIEISVDHAALQEHPAQPIENDHSAKQMRRSTTGAEDIGVGGSAAIEERGSASIERVIGDEGFHQSIARWPAPGSSQELQTGPSSSIPIKKHQNARPADGENIAASSKLRDESIQAHKVGLEEAAHHAYTIPKVEAMIKLHSKAVPTHPTNQDIMTAAPSFQEHSTDVQPKENSKGCTYADTEAFSKTIDISGLSNEKCIGSESFGTFLKYMKGGDATWQPDEKDDFLSLMVIAAGDLKLEDDELADLIRGCKFADEKTGDGVLDPVERTKLMTKVQDNLQLTSGPDEGDPRYSTINNVACAEAFTSLGPMPFVNAVQIDPWGACPPFIRVAKYLAGGDQVYQEDEKVDLVAVLVPAAGDLRINSAEMQRLLEQVAAADQSPKDGSLSAMERTWMMTKWQANAFKGI